MVILFYTMPVLSQPVDKEKWLPLFNKPFDGINTATEAV
jgi:hypothetical protein